MIISFIEWDMGWIEGLAHSSTYRTVFLSGLVIKLVLDFWLWSYVKNKWFDAYVDEDKKLEKENQEKLRKTFN